jgi:hypothetical protein
MSLIKMFHVVKNYKLQNTKYKQITNYKLQITNKVAHELHELPRIGATSNQKFLQGPGTVFSKRVPDRRRQKIGNSYKDQ